MFYWVPEKTHAFIPAKVEREDAQWHFTSQSFEAPTCTVQIDADEAKTLHVGYDEQLKGVADICQLPAICEGALLHTVRTRYNRDEIYTNVAKILIAVNPFRHLPITGADFIERYRREDPTDLPPHIYAISRAAYDGLLNEKSPQSVLVAGESGSGKTESAKLIFKFLSEAGNGSTGIEQRILQANPILESFGNAKTVRNNNSSRFGKWVEISFEDRAIRSAHIVDYLLEQPRVIHHSSQERNFHIFYQLLKGKNLGEAKDFQILSYGTADIPGLDDAREFNTTMSAFNAMGISDEEVKEVLTMVESLIHLGNVDFLENSMSSGICQLVDPEPVQKVSQLLNIPQDQLEKCLCMDLIKVGGRGSVTVKALSQAQARSRKNAMAKLLYSKMFKWLVQRLNQSLEAETKSDQFIGVLDIAGFECFETNSLEQLFINLSNEKLQQFFNRAVFKEELRDYEAEGIKIDEFSYQDNEHILALIEGKDGLLKHLDEEVRIPKASDRTYLSKMHKKFHAHSNYTKPRYEKDPIFSIKHYAGDVSYNVDGFLEKNEDKVSPSTLTLFMNSNLGLMKSIGATLETGKKGAQTVSTNFKKSLQELMTKLQVTTPHFVRCIKPNDEKVSQKFMSPMCYQQLLYAGVMEAVRIRERGFPLKMGFSEFCQSYRAALHYKDRVDRKLPLYGIIRDPKKSVETIFALLKQEAAQHDMQWSPQQICLGHTRVFAKAEMQSVLNELRRRGKHISATAIQQLVRVFLARLHVSKRRSMVEDCQSKISALQKSMAESYFNKLGESGLKKSIAELKTYVAQSRKVFEHPKFKELADILVVMFDEREFIDTVRSLDEKNIKASDLQVMEVRMRELNLVGQQFDKLEILLLERDLDKAVKSRNVQWFDTHLLGNRAEVVANKLIAKPADVKEIIAEILRGSSIKECRELADILHKLDSPEPTPDSSEITQAIRTSELPKTSEFAETHELPKTCELPKLEPVEPSRKDSKEQPKKERVSLESGKKKKMGLDRMIRKFDQAAKECDFEAFENIILNYRTEAPEVHKFLRIYEKLQEEKFVADAFRTALGHCKRNPDSEQPITQMRNLLKLAERFDMREVLQYRDRLEDCVRDNGKQKDAQSYIEDMRSKYDYREYPRLRDWIRDTSFTVQETISEPFLLRDAQRDMAIQLFKKIRAFVTCKQGIDPMYLVQDIMKTACTSKDCANEVYFQIMNQMTNNEDHHEMSSAWDLLEKLVETVAPSNDMRYYFLTFMSGFKEEDEDRFVAFLTSFQETVSGRPKRRISFDAKGLCSLKRNTLAPSINTPRAEGSTASGISVSSPLRNKLDEMEMKSISKEMEKVKDSDDESSDDEMNRFRALRAGKKLPSPKRKNGLFTRIFCICR